MQSQTGPPGPGSLRRAPGAPARSGDGG